MNTKRVVTFIIVITALMPMIPPTNAGYVTSVPIHAATVLTGCWATPSSRCQPNSLRAVDHPSIWYVRDGYSVGFRVPFVPGQRHISYELTYRSKQSLKGIAGSHDFLDTETEFVRSPVILGSCSSGGTCVVDPDVTEIHLRADVTDNVGDSHVFETSL